MSIIYIFTKQLLACKLLSVRPSVSVSYSHVCTYVVCGVYTCASASLGAWKETQTRATHNRLKAKSQWTNVLRTKSKVPWIEVTLKRRKVIFVLLCRLQFCQPCFSFYSSFLSCVCVGGCVSGDVRAKSPSLLKFDFELFRNFKQIEFFIAMKYNGDMELSYKLIWICCSLKSNERSPILG